MRSVLACVLATLPAVGSAMAAPEVAVVKGTHGIKTVRREAQGVERYHGVVTQCLRRAGVAFNEITDEDVAAGKLKGMKLAILAYNPRLAPGEVEELERFVKGGGKVIAFYSANRRLLRVLGMRTVRHVSQERRGDFASIRFRADSPVANAPAVAKQATWNISVVEPVRPDVTVVATWFDRSGKDTGHPAIVVGPNGGFVTHVLLSDDPDNKVQMMLALVGYFVPDVWTRGAAALLDRAEGQSRRAEEKPVEDLPAEQRGRIADGLRKVKTLTGQARSALGADQPATAWALARKAETAADTAFFSTYPSRKHEFRGVWIHTAYGVADWGWEKSARVLAENGFNAVIPNVCSAGLAQYESKLLPVDPRVAEEGDQVAQCVAAAHRHGLEVHAWKVNYNLGWRVSKAFRAEMSAAGRLQRDPKGNELTWLCPCHPDNVAVERDSMLELVRNYDLDGIHFDYIRYPGLNGCYCDGCRERFEKQLGKRVTNWPQDVMRGPHRQAYLDFRRRQITNLVAAVAEAARKIKPNIKVSAAVFNSWPTHRDTVGQDWVNWVKAGYLDFVCPMNYTSSDARFERLVREQVRWVGHRVPVYPGIGAGTGTRWTATPEATIRQVLLTRTLSADGFTIFQYSEDVGRRFLPALAAGVTSAPAAPPHRRPRTAPPKSE